MADAHISDAPSPSAVDPRRWAVGLLLAVVVGAAVGAFTAYGQGWLGDSTTSLTNSAGPWCLAAFLVARYQRRIVPAALAAMATLACCELGYAVANSVRGGTNSSSTVAFWLVAALLAGPPIGIAGTWSTGDGLRRGLGVSVIGGVLLGEGVYGWSTIADTTDWRYWAVEAAVGVLVVVWAATRVRRPVPIALTSGLGVLTAAVVFAFGRLA